MESYQIIGMVIGWIIALILTADKLIWSKAIRESKNVVIEQLKGEIASLKNKNKSLEGQLHPEYQISMINQAKELQLQLVQKMKAIKVIKSTHVNYKNRRDFFDKMVIEWFDSILYTLEKIRAANITHLVQIDISTFWALVEYLDALGISKENFQEFEALKKRYAQYEDSKKETPTWIKLMV